jgi:glucan phosphorylase
MPNRDDLIPEQRTVAYFSMEVGIDPAMPTYSGGFGVLAGDTLRAAADLGAPVVGVTLLHRKGYFRQHLDTNGTQEEYDMFLGKLLCSGVDLWLNTPQKPQEASGTSGMKAALNGVPSCSVLDG